MESLCETLSKINRQVTEERCRQLKAHIKWRLQSTLSETEKGYLQECLTYMEGNEKVSLQDALAISYILNGGIVLLDEVVRDAVIPTERPIEEQVRLAEDNGTELDLQTLMKELDEAI